MAAAEAEANTIEQRWLRMVDGNGSGGLNLESLLRAQERVTESEREYVTSVLTYNLAVINLKRSNGTLLQSQAVSVNESCREGCEQIDLHKGNPVEAFQQVIPEGPFPSAVPLADPVGMGGVRSEAGEGQASASGSDYWSAIR